MNPFRFKIPRRSKVCLICQKSLVAPLAVQSLIKGEEDAPIREDYCLDCFDEKKLAQESWGHWTIELKEKQKELSFDQRAMELFKEKVEQGEMKAALFLAQYLQRKKQLIHRKEIKKEGFLFYEDPLSEELYPLEKEETSLTDLQELKKIVLKELLVDSKEELL